MEMRQAIESDLAAVVQVYADAIECMRGTPGDIEWDLAWHPTAESLAAAIGAGELFVAIEDGVVLGAFVLNRVQAPAYAAVSWSLDAAPKDVAVLHLLVVAPSARGKGAGRQLVEEAKRLACASGARTLRLDVLANNEAAIALYRSCGFTDLGVLDLEVDEGFTRPAHPMDAAFGDPDSHLS